MTHNAQWRGCFNSNDSCLWQFFWFSAVQPNTSCKVYVTKVNLRVTHLISCPPPLYVRSPTYPPCILVSASSSSSAGRADTRELLKRLHLEKRDEMRCATVSREMKISVSLEGVGMARFNTLHFSLYHLPLSTAVYDSHQSETKISAFTGASSLYQWHTLQSFLSVFGLFIYFARKHIICMCTFSWNFSFHLHMTEVINVLHFDLCSLCLSAWLIVRLQQICSFGQCSLSVNELWSGIT